MARPMLRANGRTAFGGGGKGGRTAAQAIRGIASAKSARSAGIGKSIAAQGRGGFGSVARTNAGFGNMMRAANAKASRAGGSKG